MKKRVVGAVHAEFRSTEQLTMEEFVSSATEIVSDLPSKVQLEEHHLSQ